MVQLAWKRMEVWIERRGSSVFDKSVLGSQLYIVHFNMFVKNCQVYRRLFRQYKAEGRISKRVFQ